MLSLKPSGFWSLLFRQIAGNFLGEGFYDKEGI